MHIFVRRKFTGQPVIPAIEDLLWSSIDLGMGSVVCSPGCMVPVTLSRSRSLHCRIVAC